MLNVYSRAVGDVEPMVLVPSTATIGLGVAMTATGALCSGAAKPAYVCVGEAVALPDETKAYPAIRVLPATEFVTTGAASITVGSAVTLNAQGDGVTTTTTSGVFTVTKQNGDGTVVGYFA